MGTFSVLLLTASPPHQHVDVSGPFVKIEGREALLRSVELFLNRDNVKQIQVCFLPEQTEEAKRKYAPHLSFSGVKVLSAGPRWIDQVAAAADRIADGSTHVIVHDAARPAVPYTDLEALLDAAEKHAAVALACPCPTPLLEIDEGGSPMAIQPAWRYMQLLTPQAFSRSCFDEMARKKQEPHISAFHLVKGSALNVRVGAGYDASFLKAMFHLLPKPKAKAPLSPFEEAQW